MNSSFFSWWYNLAAPPPVSVNASLELRELVRRGRLTSIILLAIIILLLATIPTTNFAGKINPLLLQILGSVCGLYALAVALNRRGKVKLAGTIIVASTNIGFFFGLLAIPGGLDIARLPALDLLVIPVLLAVSLLPQGSIFPVAFVNGLYIWSILTFSHHAHDLTKILATGGYYSAVIRPIVLLLAVASVAYTWVRSANQAIVQADRAEELDISVKQQQVLLEEVNRLYEEQSLAAVTDAITNLPNHRAVMSRVEEEVARCTRTQETCAILFFDLDHFKHINDTWGHRAGDVVLHTIGNRVRAALRIEDFVGRYGGEEFAVVLTGVDVSDAAITAERLREAIALEPCIWKSDTAEGATSVSIPVTSSIGIAMYGLHGVTREDLLKQADHAMYRAKQGGRNRVCIADITETMISAIPVELESIAIKHIEVAAVQVLTAAALAHDTGTSTHAQRLVALAEATAQSLRMPEQQLHLVRLGALLHDIGKIGIPDAILHKPGPLTDEEWTVMRRHPEIGQQILVQAGGVFEALAQIVVAHHERWDGRGYPNRLVGTAIPLVARILTVVDSFDAMTSTRVYREPMTVDAACTELKRCSGTQYDPDVVDAFLEALLVLSRIDDRDASISRSSEKEVVAL